MLARRRGVQRALGGQPVRSVQDRVLAPEAPAQALIGPILLTADVISVPLSPVRIVMLLMDERHPHRGINDPEPPGSRVMQQPSVPGPPADCEVWKLPSHAPGERKELHSRWAL